MNILQGVLLKIVNEARSSGRFRPQADIRIDTCLALTSHAPPSRTAAYWNWIGP